MKTPLILTAVMAAAFLTGAGSSNVFENISPHFSTNIPIIWKAPTNHLPTGFWIYRRMPQMFSEATLSNAIVLASFQGKGFPKPSTNRVILWADHMESEPQPPSFAILPDEGLLQYSLGDRAPDSAEKVANDAAAVEHAWDCLLKIGFDPAQFVKTNVASPGDWGIYFPRQIDGIQTYRDSSEGFSFQQFGMSGKVRCFSISLPKLERQTNSAIATPQQIITCIRRHRVMVLPENDGRHYFARVKHLSEAKKFTIAKITPYYMEGIFGEEPTNNAEPPTIVMPLAELEADADFGNSNATVRLLSPILSSEVTRLLNE